MTCKNCGIEKEETLFYLISNKRRDSTCSQCRKDKIRERRNNNIEEYREYDRKRNKKPHRQKAIKESKERYKNKDKERYLQKKREESQRMRDKHAKKYYCRGKFWDKYSKGLITKMPCSVCGAIKSEAHHPDYDYPFKVVWLCREHHVQLHNEIRGIFEWLPFSDYETPCFVLFRGELAVFAPELSYKPLVIKEEEKCDNCSLRVKFSPLCSTCINNKYTLTGLDNNYIKSGKKWKN